MKQVTVRGRDGRVEVIDVPIPPTQPGRVLVQNAFSLISAGTERSKIKTAEKSLLGKARARPDLVRKVVDRARVEGVRSTLKVAQERLASLAPLGYSSAGTVIRVGPGVEGIAPGQRVACGGATWANHAEFISVPKNLVAVVPENVPLDTAAYTTIGAIALHAVRQSEAVVGETVGVVGLGLVGQLAVRILIAAGCTVIGLDPDAQAVALAERGGALARAPDDAMLESVVHEASDGLGLDSVLVCAATSSSAPVELAARLARDRGRVVVVGETEVGGDRALLYEKELEIRLSRSYGPGRYDRDYEERGRDLPPGYVRWTERRNFQAFLELVARGRLDPSKLTTHRFPVDRADEAYALLGSEQDDRPFGVLIEYQPAEVPSPVRSVRSARLTGSRIGVIGAGSFARNTLLPSLRRHGAHFVGVATESGLAAADVAKRFEFERASSSADEIIESDDIDAVVIATRHSSHAGLAAAALRSGKHVFVEKPLAINDAELAEIESAYAGTVLMVGFNRRYAPFVEDLRAQFGVLGSLILSARVNPGPVEPDHWMSDPDEGGRLIGEGCHFVDLLAHLSGARCVSVHASAVTDVTRSVDRSDEVVATLRFANGSVGTLVYAGDGNPRLAKERIEVFGGGLSAVLDDFRRLELYSRGSKSVKRGSQDKGHDRQMKAFVDAIASRVDPPDPQTYFDSSRATLALARSLRTGAPISLD